MKKLICLFLAASALIYSCQKPVDDHLKTAVDANGTALKMADSNNITWDMLPAKLKNAIPLNSMVENNGANSQRDYSNVAPGFFGPFGGFTGNTFAINPPGAPNTCKLIAIGLGDNGTYVNKLIVWYQKEDGTVVTYRTGEGISFSFINLTGNEYIKGIEGSSGAFLNKLKIITNRQSLVKGGSGGTAFSKTVPYGFQIVGFRGRSGALIDQIIFDYNCLPWTQLERTGGKDIAVNANGVTYLTTTDGKVFKSTSDSWTPVSDNNAESIAANGNRVCMVDKTGKIFELYNNIWYRLPRSNVKDVAIDNENKVWIVDDAGKVYRYNEEDWDLMSETDANAKRIAAGAGAQVWIVNGNGKVFKRNGARWDLMRGSLVREIAVGNDGTAWVTQTGGNIFSWNGNDWIEICGSAGTTISSNNKKVMMVNTTGKIFELKY